MLELIEHRGPLPWVLALALLLASLALLVTLMRHRWPVRVFPAYIAAVVAPYVAFYLLGSEYARGGRIWFITAGHLLAAGEAAWIVLKPKERSGAGMLIAGLSAIALIGFSVSNVGILEMYEHMRPFLTQYRVIQTACIAGTILAGFPALYACIKRGAWDWRTWHGLILSWRLLVPVMLNAEYRWLQGEGYRGGWEMLAAIENTNLLACAIAWIVVFSRSGEVQSGPARAARAPRAEDRQTQN